MGWLLYSCRLISAVLSFVINIGNNNSRCPFKSCNYQLKWYGTAADDGDGDGDAPS